jgi:sulfatase maturation enzyme AslB (radical SAM superfamily)
MLDSDIESDSTIDDIIRIFDESMLHITGRSITVELLGGEPFLFIDRLNQICKYIIDHYSEYKFKFVTSTNGMMYSDEIINTIKKYNILLCISIDGNKLSHNINRILKNGKGSYDYIIDNIGKFIKSGINLIAHCTLNKSNIGYLKESINNLVSIGFKRIEFGFVSDDFNIIRDHYMSIMKQLIYDNYFIDNEITIENINTVNVNSHYVISTKDCNGQLLSEQKYDDTKLTERNKVDQELSMIYQEYISNNR